MYAYSLKGYRTHLFLELFREDRFINYHGDIAKKARSAID